MKNLTIILFLFASILSYGQQELKFKINGLKNANIYLARYFGDKLYYADTARSKNGTVVFNKKEFIGGIYAVVCPESRYFEFIMANEDVELETDILDFNGKMKIKKSKNNKLFYEYISFLGSMKERAKTLQGDDSKDKREALDLEVKQYQKNNILNKELLAAKVLAMSVDPEIPEEIKDNDSLRYRFYLDHYWDNIDVTDSRIVHTPVYHKKLDFFFKKMIPQISDTICKYSYNLIDKMDPNSDLFKYTVHHITYEYETSNVISMDEVFECMADKYYCPPSNSKAFWMEDNKLIDLCNKAEKLRHSKIFNLPFKKDLGYKELLSNFNEENVRNFYNNSSNSLVEGVYDFLDNSNKYQIRVAVFKSGFRYFGHVLETNQKNILKPKVKFILEETSSSSTFSLKWLSESGDLKKTIAFYEKGVLTFNIGKNYLLLKLYPNSSSSDNSKPKNIDWLGNGSGIIISNDGYIITNNHVVQDINDIEIEIKRSSVIEKFKAKVIKTDPINDLAILKIDDANFTNFKSIPYNFQLSPTDIGTEVYSLGYPMALTLMGKDIKFTDGRISSKTGFKGDITTYQSTTPIQPGNSGGPLFDHKANLIGINSSGLNKEIYDNVSYSIKTNYIMNLLEFASEPIKIPKSTWIGSKPLTDQIKILSKYVVLIKVK